jgi:chromate transporter
LTHDGEAPPTTAELFGVFLRVGATAFGMSVMRTVRSTPVQRGWLSQRDVDEAFGVVQLYPGAIMMDLVAFIGYRLRRIRGAVAAAAGFLTPSLVLLLALSWAYFTYGARPVVRDMVVGLDGIVVGVLTGVTVDFGVQHARVKLPAVLAVAAFVVSAAGGTVLWVVLGALVVGAVALRGRAGADVLEANPGPVWSWRRLVLASMPAVVVAVVVAAAAVGSGALAEVTVTMAKIGSVAPTYGACPGCAAPSPG